MTVTDEDRALLTRLGELWLNEHPDDDAKAIEIIRDNRIAAAQAERDAVVKWLRSAINGSETVKYGNLFADEIEAGEHLK